MSLATLAWIAAQGVAADSARSDSLIAARPFLRHLTGTFWSWVVPITIFVLATVATLALYARFARERDDLEEAARSRPGPER